MSNKPKVILVNIKRLKDRYVATSADLHGLHVGAPEFSLVVREIPDVIRAIFRAKYGVDVKVQEATSETEDVFPLRYTAEAA